MVSLLMINGGGRLVSLFVLLAQLNVKSVSKTVAGAAGGPRVTSLQTFSFPREQSQMEALGTLDTVDWSQTGA
jgi:hypothetical protein